MDMAWVEVTEISWLVSQHVLSILLACSQHVLSMLLYFYPLSLAVTQPRTSLVATHADWFVTETESAMIARYRKN